MKKCLVTILFQLLLFTAWSQNDPTFSVSKPRQISIVCPSVTLMGNSFYYFKVNGAATSELVPSKFIGGAVWLNDTALCIHTSDKTSADKKYTLELFLKKNAVSVFKREFTILPAIEKYAAPRGGRTSTVSFFGLGDQLTGNDTFPRKSLKSESPFAHDWSSPDKEYKIISFKMEVTCNGKSETLSSNKSSLTPEMKKKLEAITPGSTITLKEVKYTSINASPDDLFAGPFKITVKE